MGGRGDIRLTPSSESGGVCNPNGLESEWSGSVIMLGFELCAALPYDVLCDDG